MPIPVYAFTGFLESGKTKFIQETLEDPRFNDGTRTLLLVMEEGEEEYDLSRYPGKNVWMETVDDLDDLNEQTLALMQAKYRAERVVAELNGKICGFAVLNHISKPENPFMFERDFLDIDEFGVDEACRRKGAASAMVRFIRDYARKKGFRRVELNMWEFNRGALAFYEAAGFTTYRRYMEIKIPE